VTMTMDTLFSDVPALDDGIMLGHGGDTMLHLPCDREFTAVFLLKMEHEMAGTTLEDFIRCAPSIALVFYQRPKLVALSGRPCGCTQSWTSSMNDTISIETLLNAVFVR
jgi:hypothetical protein